MTNAFVIMSFDLERLWVFDELIAPALTPYFSAYRVDSRIDQHTIMRDVVLGIVDSPLIIADLTQLKPNVFYELGIAHALGKPVCMIAEKGTRPPFDISAYRVLMYSKDGEGHTSFISALREVARTRAQGTARFSSPVADSYEIVRHFLETDASTPTLVGDRDGRDTSFGTEKPASPDSVAEQIAALNNAIEDANVLLQKWSQNIHEQSIVHGEPISKMIEKYARYNHLLDIMPMKQQIARDTAQLMDAYAESLYDSVPDLLEGIVLWEEIADDYFPAPWISKDDYAVMRATVAPAATFFVNELKASVLAIRQTADMWTIASSFSPVTQASGKRIATAIGTIVISLESLAAFGQRVLSLAAN